MTDTEQGSDVSAQGANNESLGFRLRAARESQDLTVESVAHTLHLSQQRIIDMENDEYRFSNAETYAKGYLRAYARLLGLNPEELIRDFDQKHYTDTIERHEPRFIIKRQITAGDRWVRWITYSIGMALIFLVAIWWRSQPGHASASQPLVASEADKRTPFNAAALEQQTGEPTMNANEHPSQGLDNQSEAGVQDSGLLPSSSQGVPNSTEIAPMSGALSGETAQSPTASTGGQSGGRSSSDTSMRARARDDVSGNMSTEAQTRDDASADTTTGAQARDGVSSRTSAVAQTEDDASANTSARAQASDGTSSDNATVSQSRGESSPARSARARLRNVAHSNDDSDDQYDDQNDGRSERYSERRRRSHSHRRSSSRYEQSGERRSLQKQLEREFGRD